MAGSVQRDKIVVDLSSVLVSLDVGRAREARVEDACQGARRDFSAFAQYSDSGLQIFHCVDAGTVLVALEHWYALRA